MNFRDLVRQLNSKGIEVLFSNSTPFINAPKGVMTQSLLNEIDRYKAELCAVGHAPARLKEEVIRCITEAWEAKRGGAVWTQRDNPGRQALRNNWWEILIIAEVLDYLPDELQAWVNE